MWESLSLQIGYGKAVLVGVPATEERFDKWLTKYSEDLAACGQLIDRDVEYKIYCALSAPSGALVMMVPYWSLDTGRIQDNFWINADDCNGLFRAVRHCMLCSGVQVLIAYNVCAQVLESERRVPPQAT
jgi:hypothetical protein